MRVVLDWTALRLKIKMPHGKDRQHMQLFDWVSGVAMEVSGSGWSAVPTGRKAKTHDYAVLVVDHGSTVPVDAIAGSRRGLALQPLLILLLLLLLLLYVLLSRVLFVILLATQAGTLRMRAGFKILL